MHPFLPAELPSVPFGFVLVRVRVPRLDSERPPQGVGQNGDWLCDWLPVYLSGMGWLLAAREDG
jgi:hypothetical protein